MKRNESFSWYRRVAMRAVVAAAAVGAMAAGTGSAVAVDQPCTMRTTSTPFSFIGDYNKYFVAPNGGFESTADGVQATNWIHYGGSRLYSGFQEPWYVAGGGNQAVYMPYMASVLSPWFCVNNDEDSLRFFYAPLDSTARMQIKMYVWNGVDLITKTVVLNPLDSPNKRVSGGLTWYTTPRIAWPDLRDVNGQQWVMLSLESVSSGGTPAGMFVDDVMVDPWRTQ